MQPVLLTSALVLIFFSSQGSSQAWNFRGINNGFSRTWGLQRFSNYGVAQPEPEPEPEPLVQSRTLNQPIGRRITRRLVGDSGNLFQSLTATTQRPPLLTTRRSFTRFSVRSSTTSSPFLRRIEATVRPTTQKATTTTRKQRTTRRTTTRRTTTSTTRRRPISTTTTSAPLQRDLIDSLFDDLEGDVKEWEVRPGKFEVIAAVPDQPVKESESKQRLPKAAVSDRVSSFGQGIKFMPVPAVPTKSEPLVKLEQNPTVKAIDITIPSSNEEIRSNVIESDITSVIEDRKNAANKKGNKSRKEFKRCQSKCVQQFCLPVENLQVYEGCVEKCKDLCGK